MLPNMLWYVRLSTDRFLLHCSVYVYVLNLGLGQLFNHWLLGVFLQGYGMSEAPPS